jgi:hypothetical protein
MNIQNIEVGMVLTCIDAICQGEELSVKVKSKELFNFTAEVLVDNTCCYAVGDIVSDFEPDLFEIYNP